MFFRIINTPLCRVALILIVLHFNSPLYQREFSPTVDGKRDVCNLTSKSSVLVACIQKLPYFVEKLNLYYKSQSFSFFLSGYIFQNIRVIKVLFFFKFSARRQVPTSNDATLLCAKVLVIP